VRVASSDKLVHQDHLIPATRIGPQPPGDRIQSRAEFSNDPHAEHVALLLAPVGGLCHRIRPPVPYAAKATVIPAKAGIQASLILDPGFRRADGVSDNSLPRLHEVYRQSLWTLTTCTARGFPERTECLLPESFISNIIPWTSFRCN
jgi:hypothetical protein